jgi:hypothetical protein
MSGKYNGLVFRTVLEANWAAFFDLAGWRWDVNPEPVENWAPDFRVSFDCWHSECGGSHSLLIAVLPLSTIEDFGRHPCTQYYYGGYIPETDSTRISEDSSAAFGINPSATYWQMVHGSGGGIENVFTRIPNSNELWKKAQSLVKACA